MEVTKLQPTPTRLSPAPTIGPSISSTVHLGLTITFTTLYGLLFVLIIWQLMLILYYKHRRLSYQTIFLFTCLIWAGLRITLFSFYFKNCLLSNNLSPFSHWFLFAFPVYLQYKMLSILVFYFVLVLAKMLHPTELKVYRRRVFIIVFISNVIFLTTNISCSIIAPHKQTVTYVRVSISYSIFLAAALVLCYCIIKLTRISSAKIFLEGQGISLCQAVAACTLIALLFISRAIYNILAVSPIKIPSFNFGWINVSDQGEASRHGAIDYTTDNYAFVSFGCVLFVWELLPTFVTVWFFRVRIPDCRIASSSIKSDSFHTKSYFFDNPNRYDSDDDLSNQCTPTTRGPGGLVDIPRFGQPVSPNVLLSPNDSRIKVISSYGSVPPLDTFGTPKDVNYPSPHIRGTTPPILFPRTGSGANAYQPFAEEPDA